MNSALLQADRLSKHFARLAAVDEVSISIESSEFFALLGPSGCGKTTLLRMLAGFEKPSHGRVLLDGRDITHLPPSRRPLNLMFQSYALFPHLTVARNIAYGLEMEHCARSEIRRRVNDILDMTELTDFAERKPGQLSGGQRQRVALARALVKRPRMLLLDEPLAALDKKLRTQMQLELKRLQHEVGISFVVVTHDQEEVLVMADRAAVMDAGSLVQTGTPHELYETPRNRFVADFIGVMNFIPGRAVAGGIEVERLGVLRAARNESVGVNDNAWLTVRPERIRLDLEKPVDADNALQAEIYDIAYLGRDLKVLLRTTQSDTCLEARVTSTQAERAGFIARGRKLWCSWRAAHAAVLGD